jgi:hypothetical protein
MKWMNKKNLTIISVVVIILVIGISIGMNITSPNEDGQKNSEKQNKSPNVDTSTYTVQRNLSQDEKLAIKYLLEATSSTNVNISQLNQLGGCKEDSCELVNNFYDINDNITGRAPEFVSKPGTYYVGSDIANQAPKGEGQTLIYILIPPQSMMSMEEKEPENTYGNQSYQQSNLVVFNLTRDSEGKIKIKNYDAFSAADYDKYYQYNEFISSEIGQLITKEANLNWRAVKVQSETKFE